MSESPVTGWLLWQTHETHACAASGRGYAAPELRPDEPCRLTPRAL